MWVEPSLTGSWRRVRVTVGATLATVTLRGRVGRPVASSESVTLRVTVELVGPSAKVQSKLPHGRVLKSLAARRAVGAAAGGDELNVSVPGSVIV